MNHFPSDVPTVPDHTEDYETNPGQDTAVVYERQGPPPSKPPVIPGNLLLRVAGGLILVFIVFAVSVLAESIDK